MKPACDLHVTHCSHLRVQPVHEYGVEDPSDEVQWVPLDIDKGEQQAEHLLGRELREFGLEHALDDIEKLEAVGRMEIKLLKLESLTDCYGKLLLSYY